MTTKHKPVVCLESLICYLNPKSASESTGCSRDGIIRVCKGKNKKVNNSTWMYAYDFIMSYGLDYFLDNVMFGEDILDLMGGIIRYER